MAVSSELEPHAGLPLARFLCLGSGLTLAALDEGVLRQPAAYLLPGVQPSLLLARTAAIACGVGLACLGWQWRLGLRALSLTIAATSITLAAAGPAWYESFGHRTVAWLVGLAVPASVAGSLGLALGTGSRSLHREAHALEVIRYAIQPFRLLLALGLLVAGAALGGRLGAWRSSAWLGAGFAVLGLSLPSLRHYLFDTKLTLRELAPSALGLSLSLASLGFARASLPNDELARYPGEVVFSSHGAGQYVVSSVQQSFEIYRGDVLRIASVDAKRYAECLVQPALALSVRRARVLVLGTGDGLAERELLAYPDVERITTLSDDLSLATLARNNAYFNEMSGNSLGSPRVRLIESEALPWLASHADEFEVIIADLPDPSDYRQGKNYTHYFYEQLALHLTPDGVFVSQATSSAASKSSFSSIVASVESAGFLVHTYRAGIPTLGEWGFVLGSRQPLAPVKPLSPISRRVLSGTSYVTTRQLELMLTAPPARDSSAQGNTLAEQPVVDLLNEERRARGL